MPSQKHVVSFFPDGSVEHTRSADMDAVFGTGGEMKRVTDIGRREEGYFINWLLGPFAGREHTWGMSIGYGIVSYALHPVECTMYFPTYEAAVLHEVKMLNAMRCQGVRFNGKTA
jgi:hypothetical protein